MHNGGIPPTDRIPDVSPVLVSRGIRWALIVPVLFVTGFAIALLGFPWRTTIFSLAPFIMAFLYGNDPGRRADE